MMTGALDMFSAACYYFGEGLTDQLKKVELFFVDVEEDDDVYYYGECVLWSFTFGKVIISVRFA